MHLGVLPGLCVYMNVSASGTNSNILRHTNEYKLQHDFVDSMDLVC